MFGRRTRLALPLYPFGLRSPLSSIRFFGLATRLPRTSFAATLTPLEFPLTNLPPFSAKCASLTPLESAFTKIPGGGVHAHSARVSFLLRSSRSLPLRFAPPSPNPFPPP